MGVVIKNSTLDGGVTPVCNSCGAHLCWDIAMVDYAKTKEFWDNWLCEDCNPKAVGSLTRWRMEND